MTKLPKAHLTYDKQQADWVLKKEGADRALRRFATKDEATAGGVLAEAVGKDGASVRIHLKGGPIQEERTFPGSKDPKKSPG